MAQEPALSVTDGPIVQVSDPRRRASPLPILAVSLAVVRDDRILLAQRVAPPFAGRFTLPGGVVELGETLAAAALRELREEVGVEARLLGFNRHVEVIEPGVGRPLFHYVIASFVGAWIAGEGKIGPEAQAIVWARREDVGALATTMHLAPVLDGAWALAAAARAAW